MKARALIFAFLATLGACTPAYYVESDPALVAVVAPVLEIEHIIFSPGDYFQLVLMGRSIVDFEFIGCLRGTRSYDQFSVSEIVLPGIVSTSVMGVTPEAPCASEDIMWHTHPPVPGYTPGDCGVSVADMEVAITNRYPALLITDARKRLCFFTLEEIEHHFSMAADGTAVNSLFVSGGIGRYIP